MAFRNLDLEDLRKTEEELALEEGSAPIQTPSLVAAQAERIAKTRSLATQPSLPMSEPSSLANLTARLNQQSYNDAAAAQALNEPAQASIQLPKIEALDQPDQLTEAPSDLEQALIAKERGRREALLSRAGEKFLEAGTYGAYKADKKAGEFELAQGEAPLDNIATRKAQAALDIKLENAGIELKDDKAMSDPQSDISQLYRDQLSKALPGLGIDAYKNLSATQLQKLIPSLKNSVDSGLSEYERRKLAQTDRSLAIRESELEGIVKPREARLGEQFAHKKSEKDELSDKQVEEIASLDKGLGLGAEIQNLLPQVEKFIGPYASKLEEGSRYIPGVERDPNFVLMQQRVGTTLADYVKAISGAAVSEQEAQRLRKNIPTMEDKPAEFKTKLNEFNRLLEEYKNTKLKAYKQYQGKGPSTREPSEKQSSSELRRQTKDGRIAIFDANKKFLRYEE